MKAISLWQPWGSLITTGAKKWETRHWPTKYRGPILIHAAARRNISELTYYCAMWSFQGGLGPLKGEVLNVAKPKWVGISWRDLPLGALIGKADLVDCRKTDSLTQAEIGDDEPFGDFSLGRFAWRMENAVRFETPIPWKGRQGPFDVPDHVISEAAVS